MTTSTQTITRRGPSGPVALGAAFGLTTVFGIAMHALFIVIDDADPNRPQGPVESIQSIALFGGLALVVALAVALPLRREPHTARIGAIVLGALALLTLPFFWCGAPAVFGASSAWLAGLFGDSEPQSGAARGFGIVGMVVAILVVVATVVLYAVSLASL